MVEACLIDVYETILTCDFTAGRRELPALAGVDPAAWQDAYLRVAPTQNIGQLSRAEVYDIVLRACAPAQRPRDGLIDDLVNLDRELLLATAMIYPDTMPFLELLRSRGLRVVIVSNCGENTRALLTSTGIADLADSLVLSCEVGSIKPAAPIFRYALAAAGVAAADALFVDDQLAFCAGAEVLGISAVQIVRDGELPAGAVRSLLDLVPQL